MIKFINQIDNLLNEIIENKKMLFVFYNEHCNSSKKLISIINNYDFDIDLEVIVIDKYLFLQKNYNKLEKNYFNYYLQNNSTQFYYNTHYQNIMNNLSFLFYNNIIDIDTPHFYFIEKINMIPKVLYHSAYSANLDYSNNFVKMLMKFTKPSKPKSISKIPNQFILEQVGIDLPLEEIKKVKIFI